MQFFAQNKDSCRVGITLQVCLYILFVCSTYSQEIFQSQIILSESGTQYSPVVPSAQLISTTIQSSFKFCAISCNKNVLCRIFDYGVNQPQQCRLFEGDLDTLGSIIPSPSSSSMVGTINITPALFTAYGQSCALSSCPQARYLQCGSDLICQCMPHTYWDSSTAMCVPQSPILGSACQVGVNMCREDLNYTCLQFYQCGPLSILSGITIANSQTVLSDNSTARICLIQRMTLMESSGETLIAADSCGNRILRFVNTGSDNYNISIVVDKWSGDSLNGPFNIFVDEKNGNNLYVCDSSDRVVLFTGMQSVSPLPEVVAGGQCNGYTPTSLCGVTGVNIDNASNVIVTDIRNNRVMLWPPNAGSGVVIVGSGSYGSGPQDLNSPYDLFIDQNNSWFYVADSANARIQRFPLYGSIPKTGTMVAGNGYEGVASSELNSPLAVWVSEKTGNIYIADAGNNRIQRWTPNATEGVTVAGSPLGEAGSTATLLNGPFGVVVNANETVLYVCDSGNQRIQKFQLI